MTALKALVVGMGLAILGMIVLIGFTAAKRFGGGNDSGPAREYRLGLPAGAAILSAVPGDGQLALTLRLADGATRVTVIDLATGRAIANVTP
ncbi:hypothetical protein EDC65_1552 [Stella humosa]|uniref:Uncharacterized protein n=1 Tax=Stella humosa TaxID=94 RepID=A0A3N1MF12_9PROT|nr:hypothetical protein [Stella humosa]ROP99765.1 hypothetical protein EDC65_1552 [Stella humosa]BBK31008.1 hypothetical protein STHU_16420 [Stella humosa]